MISYKMKQGNEITEEVVARVKHGVYPSQNSIVVFVEKMGDAEKILKLLEALLNECGIECILAEKAMTLFARGISIVFKTPNSPSIGYGYSLYWLDMLPDNYKIKGSYEWEHYCNMKSHLRENCEELDGILEVMSVVMISDKLCGV